MNAAPQPGETAKFIILIVDDSEANLQTLEYLLDSAGMELHYAADGPSALARAATLQPDLILLDVMMPGMDGFEVCSRLRADPQLAEVPVIMLTALDDRQSRLRGLNAGADDFISKPFDQTELRTRVRGILRLNRFRRLQQAVERIREQAELIDLSPDVVIVCNLGQVITYWNPAAGSLYGWSAAEAIGQRADLLLARGENADLPGMEPMIADEWRGEIAQLTREKREVIVDSRRKLLRDASGQPKAILIINTDLTEKKRIEAQLFRVQRLESIGALAGGIAHDLNNMLSPILMAVDLLRGSQPPENRDILEMVGTSARRGADMVRQILSFARGVSGEYCVSDLKLIINDMIRLARDTFPRSIRIEPRLAAELWQVMGNATQIHQVLLNLCVNARDAMVTGGVLTITADKIDLAGAISPWKNEPVSGPYVRLSVSDSGHGIPPELMANIFDPFFTTKEAGKGTGLGLSTVMGIVKQHGGFVDVVSRTGQGTTFSVYLPASDVPLSAEPLTSEDLPAGQGELILLVDDEAVLLEMTRLILETHNYRVLTASHGADAIRLYAESHEEIQVVVTDMMMPIMDGAATIRELRKINPEVKIVSVSGLGSSAYHSVLAGLPVIASIKKPYAAEALLRTLRKAIESLPATEVPG